MSFRERFDSFRREVIANLEVAAHGDYLVMGFLSGAYSAAVECGNQALEQEINQLCQQYGDEIEQLTERIH